MRADEVLVYGAGLELTGIDDLGARIQKAVDWTQQGVAAYRDEEWAPFIDEVQEDLHE